MADIEFITAEVCPFAQRTHLVLTEKGLSYKHTEIDLSNKPAWFEQVSPYSKVPVLRVGDDVIYESAIINEFIDETWPEPPFMPATPAGRAYARIWIDYANTKFAVSFYKLLLAADDAARREHAEALVGQLRFMEREGLAKLGAGPYWLGREVSLVDFTFYPHFERFAALRHNRGVVIPDDCPRLEAWLGAMRARESVRALAHSDDYYIDSYARYAAGTAEGVTAREMRRA
jgi:glutathione S-transferase